jgi:type I restriction enzyme S subunit
MGVKLGYKATNVGVIPEDWHVEPLGKIGDVKMCRRIFKHQTRPVADVPFYKIGTFGSLPDAFISQELFDEYKSKYSFPKKGEVLISAAGTIGRTVVYNGEPAYFQDSNIVWIDNDQTKVTNGYLWHFFKIIKWSTSDGGTVARLYNDNIKTKIYIPLPPILEQRAIAEVLSDVDELLGALEALIAKKRAIKQGAMQQLLTAKKRLPGFSGEWNTKPIGDLFTIEIGSSKTRHITPGGRFFIVDMGSVSTDGRLIASKCTDYEGDFLSKGDLVMPKDDIGGGKIIGKVAYIGEDSKYVLGDHVYVLRLRAGNAFFFSYLINRSETNAALKSKVSGSAQLGLARRAVEEQDIPIPGIEEQNAIANVLSDIDTEIQALEDRRDKTRAIKQGMMQQLLTGRIRLVKPQPAEAKV